MAPSPPPRRLRALAAAAAVAAAAVPLLAAPAAAQTSTTTTTTDRSGATSAQAVLLRIARPTVLPGLPATPYLLELAVDPVSGTVRKVGTSAPEAQGTATVLAGSLLGSGLDSGRATATLPAPTEASVDPARPLAEALAGTPLEGLLKIELLPAKAAVTAAPTSRSDATVARIAVGLPAGIADALAPLTAGLAGAVDTVLGGIAAQVPQVSGPICQNIPAVAAALAPITDPVGGALGGLLGVPGSNPINEAVDVTLLQAVCNLATTIEQVSTALQDGLLSLAGEGGVLRTGLIETSQSITNEPGKITSTASASIAGLTVLGQNPFASTSVLRSTSTAVVTGAAGGADATVDSTIATLRGGTVDPFADLRVELLATLGQVANAALPPSLSTGLNGLITQLNNVLAPVGVQVTPDEAAPGFAGCPTELGGQNGVFEAPDGACAAASVDGVGIAVLLPEALGAALGLGGLPLISLEVVPTAAVAKTATTTSTSTTAAPPPAPFTRPLPRTGGEALLGATGLALLAGAALVRRRHY